MKLFNLLILGKVEQNAILPLLNLSKFIDNYFY